MGHAFIQDLHDVAVPAHAQVTTSDFEILNAKPSAEMPAGLPRDDARLVCTTVLHYGG